MPDVFVNGLLCTDKVPGPKFCTFAFTSSSVMLWLYGTVNVSPIGLYLTFCSCTTISITFVVGVLFLSYAVIVICFVPAVPVGVPVIFPFVNVNPSGKSVTTIGLLSRIPTPPGLSSAVTEISGIGSLFVTVAPSAVTVGPVTSFTVTGTFTVSCDPSG